jgi:hypothetical protein
MRKFIINNNEIILGNVNYHRELAHKNLPNNIIGGGYWEWSPKRLGNKIFFYGKSEDFGPVTKEQLIEAFQNTLLSDDIENAEIIFSTYNRFSDVLIEYNIPIK